MLQNSIGISQGSGCRPFHLSKKASSIERIGMPFPPNSLGFAGLGEIVETYLLREKPSHGII